MLLTPDLTAEQLERLARQDAPDVRAAVAAHPNTPPHVLSALAPEFPGEVLGNPGLPLLRLAHPGLVLEWPRATQLILIRHARAPRWLRRYALTHAQSDYQVALATNPALEAETVAVLAAHPAWQVRARIAARPDLPAALIEALAADPDYGVRMYIAARADLPESGVARLRRDSSVFVRQVLEQTQRAGLAAFFLGLCVLGL
ncbi:hypothetical protein HNQ07_002786 [Deinococcus metalli]|uniref:Leucine rich repeat variant n=1 Tax=Deinococcus metalli TaxID=1141878 RepID=A0A7W8NRV6_9DEIO|nr:hypothetical protein [Deinococcus metalli]MBB5377313.1 hypothetical protein [Deinococcus metalli]GHF47438.1 hypothetical protein GCM10017781_24610 [Deinococcus metalli]